MKVIWGIKFAICHSIEMGQMTGWSGFKTLMAISLQKWRTLDSFFDILVLALTELTGKLYGT